MKLILSTTLYPALAAGPALAQSALSNPTRTPGASNPAVAQGNIKETICKRGWAKSVRPPRAC